MYSLWLDNLIRLTLDWMNEQSYIVILMLYGVNMETRIQWLNSHNFSEFEFKRWNGEIS